MNFLLSRLRALPLCGAFVLLVPAHAQVGTAPLVSGNKLSITAADLQVEARNIPPEQRSTVLAQPEAVSQFATSLFVRRALAEQAAAQGLADDASIAISLRSAREAVLAEALLERAAAAAMPGEQAVEAQARAIYRAQPERFPRPEQVHARHILILPKQGEEGATEQAAKDLLAKLRAGANFEALATEYSGDYASAKRGGDLGFFGRRSMVAEFEQAAFALQKPGDLSEPVRTQFGYHIVQLVEKRPAGVQAFEEVRDGLMQQVRTNLDQEARAAVIKKAEADAKLDADAVRAFIDSQRVR